jgi:hypothetical protein
LVAFWHSVWSKLTALVKLLYLVISNYQFIWSIASSCSIDRVEVVQLYILVADHVIWLLPIMFGLFPFLFNFITSLIFNTCLLRFYSCVPLVC